MNREAENLAALGSYLINSEELWAVAIKAERKNPWFAPQFVNEALDAIMHDMLTANKLNEWLSHYLLKKIDKTIGLIFAGNIPLVGFHDFLCCYVTGCKMKIKLSSKDDELFPFILNALIKIDPELKGRVEIVEKLKDFDAVIATGSGNTHRYFEFYFRNHPKILRKNRNSIAILTGEESPAQLDELADDIFMYFGFGCRNVSKIYVPVGYDFNVLFPHFSKYNWLYQHSKYMNNYDYNRTIMLLNNTPHLTNDFIMVTENPSIASPISMLHYEYWHDTAVLNSHLKQNSDRIQCTVSGNPNQWNSPSSVSFGQSQHPSLSDYADNIDTISFLNDL